MLFLTIPTAHSHPELLAAIIQESGLPPEHIILIATRPSLNLPVACVVIEDLGPPNIQRWWNSGIEEAIKRGATAVAVLNDDLKIDSETLLKLHGELLRTSATIASPTRPDWGPGLYENRNLFPYTPVIWGCLWILNTQSELRPDPKYVWWYGDSDLDIRARRDYAGIVTAEVYYEHYFPGKGTSNSTSLQRQTDIDAQTFEREHKGFLKRSRATQPRKLFIRVGSYDKIPPLEEKLRESFFGYVDSVGDRHRDRVVLIEPEALEPKSLLRLWESWSNVVIHNKNENENFGDLVQKVSDGAELEFVSCDSVYVLVEVFNMSPVSPKEMHIHVTTDDDSQMRDLCQQFGYILNGQPRPGQKLTLSLKKELTTGGKNRVKRLGRMKDAIFQRRR